MTLDSGKLHEVLSEWLDGHLARATLAGVEIFVSQHGERLCHIVRGVADARTGRALEPNAMYRLASMTKPITGLAALIAVRNGWFDLDDEVRLHLPEFGGMDVAALRDGKVVRIRKAHSELRMNQLLCHTSGILSGPEAGAAMAEAAPPSAYRSIESMVAYAASRPLAFDPGERAAYSAYAAFDAVALVIERKAGMPYSEFLRREVFDPLGIRDLTFHPTREHWRRMVAMHDRTTAGRLAVVEMPEGTLFEGFPPTYECAGAGLAGSPEDYDKIARLLSGGGSLDGVTIVPRELFGELAKPRVPDGVPGRAPNDSWGLGVRVKVHEDWLPEGCFGWSGAYGTHFWVDPRNGITALLFRNMRWHDTHGAGNLGVEFERNVMSCAVSAPLREKTMGRY